MPTLPTALCTAQFESQVNDQGNTDIFHFISNGEIVSWIDYQGFGRGNLAGGGGGAVQSVSSAVNIFAYTNPTTNPVLTVAGTSGGVPYFNNASSLASSAVLAKFGGVFGGGAGAAPFSSPNIVTDAVGDLILSGPSPWIDITHPTYGAKPDAQLTLTGAMTSGSPLLTITGTPSFAATDVGKLISVNMTPVQAPPAPRVTLFTTGGTIPCQNVTNAHGTTNIYIRVTETNTFGEGAPSKEVGVVCSNNGSVNQIVVFSPTTLNGATTWSVYDSIGIAHAASGKELLDPNCTNVPIGTNCVLNSIAGVTTAPPAPSVLITTIASFVSATQVNLTANATQMVGTARVSWGTDNTTALTNALNACPAFVSGATLRGCEVFVPPLGAYMIQNVTTTRQGIHLYAPCPGGIGTTDCASFWSSNTGYALSIGTVGSQSNFGSIVEGIGFKDSSGAGNLSGGLKFIQMTHSLVKNVSCGLLTNSTYGACVTYDSSGGLSGSTFESQYNAIDGLYCIGNTPDNCHKGVDFYGGEHSNNWMTHMHIGGAQVGGDIGVDFEQNPGIGGNGNNSIHQCSIEGYSVGVHGGDSIHLTITDTNLENSGFGTGTAVLFDASTTGVCYNNTLGSGVAFVNFGLSVITNTNCLNTFVTGAMRSSLGNAYLGPGTYAAISDVFITNPNLAKQTWVPPNSVVAQLSQASVQFSGSVILVSDGINATDCTVGGGSIWVICRNTGSAWVALGGGSGGTGTVTNPNGNFTIGEPIVATSATVGVASSPAYLDCTQFSGADDSLVIQNCLSALHTLNTQVGIADARGLCNATVWSANPMSGTMPASGTLLWPSCDEHTSVPFVVAAGWNLVGFGGRSFTGQVGSSLIAGTGFPATYSTGTVTVGTAGANEVITGAGTGWTTSNIAVGCAFVAAVGNANNTFGIIKSINSTTSITLNWGANNGTGAAGGSTYQIYCPVLLTGGGGASSAGAQFGMQISDLNFDCNNVAGCVSIMNWYGQQGVTFTNVAAHGFTNIGLDVEWQAQNSGPYINMTLSPGTGCTANTIPAVFRCSAEITRPIIGLSGSRGQCATTINVAVVADTNNMIFMAPDLEQTVVGISNGANIACPVGCPMLPKAGNGMSVIGGGNQSGTGTTFIHLSNFNQSQGPVSVVIQNVAQAGITNILVDDANGCTITETRIGLYTTDESGKNRSTSTQCPDKFGAKVEDFSVSTWKIPTAAGFTPSATSMLGYNSTNGAQMAWVNGASAFEASFASAPVGGSCLQSTGVIGQIVETGTACGSGSGSVTPAAQFSTAYYSVAGTASTISGVNGPTGPNSVPQFIVEVPSAGAATAPVFLLAGIVPRVVTITSDTVLATDRGNYITYSNASAIAVTLPQAGSTGFSNNFVWGTKNLGVGAVTITPTTSTIDGNATLVMNQGDSCTIYTDNSNYFSRCEATQIIAGANITLTRTANGLTIASTGGSSVAWSGITNPVSNLSLTMGSDTTAFNYATALSSAWTWANTTAATSSTSQSSPILSLCGQGWETATPANTTDCLTIQQVIANGANSTVLTTFSNSGGTTGANTGYSFLGAGGGNAAQIYVGVSGGYNTGSAGSRSMGLAASGLFLPTGVRGLFWSNAGNIDGGSIDTNVNRVSAGTVGIGTGAAGSTAGSLSLTNIIAGGLITTYNNIATVSGGVPSELATVDLAAQSASVSATTIYTPTATGMFRVSAYLKVTTPGTSSILGGTTGVVLGFTDGTDSVTQAVTIPMSGQNGNTITIASGNTGNTTSTSSNGSAIIYAKTGVAITYAIGYSSTGTTMQYEAHLKVEAL